MRAKGEHGDMTEFVTITQDFTTPALDKMQNRSRNQVTKNRKPFQERKVAFEINAAWKRCFSGREEFSYADV